MLDHLLGRLPLTEFLQLANISENVRTTLYQYCREHEPVLMKILLYQDDRLTELLEALVINSQQDAVNELDSLDKWFKLLRIQRCFEKRTGLRLMGKTRMETLNVLNAGESPALVRDFCESIGAVGAVGAIQ